MKRKMLKKLVCVSGLLFMTFPAWSAVPSTLLPNDGNWNQAPVVADVENPMFEGDMILAKGGGGGGGGGGNGGGSGSGTQSQNQEQTRAHTRTQTQLQSQEQFQERFQFRTRTRTGNQSMVRQGNAHGQVDR
jgi:hypothetical protein